MSLIKKSTIKDLIAVNKTEEAFMGLRGYTKLLHLPEIEKELILQSAKWSALQVDKLRGAIAYEDIQQQSIQVHTALLSMVAALPDEKSVLAALEEQKRTEIGKATKPKGILEDKFKNQVSGLIIGTKFIVFGWIYTLWESGGFTVGEAKATVSLLLPVFVAYISAIMNSMIKNRYVSVKLEIKKTLYIRNSLRITTYFLFILYTYALIHIIGLKAQGALGDSATLEEMNSWLALVETGLGVYIAQVVFSLFEKKE